LRSENADIIIFFPIFFKERAFDAFFQGFFWQDEIIIRAVEIWPSLVIIVTRDGPSAQRIGIAVFLLAVQARAIAPLIYFGE
jgi:hypothetical protein